MSAEPPRPPHLIRPDEVDAWLADSVVKRVTYHRTSSEAARAILERGVSVDRSWIGMYGQGFYTSTDPDDFFGGAEFAVAVRLASPLAGPMDEIDRVVDGLVRRHDPRRQELSPRVAAAVRRDLVGSG